MKGIAESKKKDDYQKVLNKKRKLTSYCIFIFIQKIRTVLTIPKITSTGFRCDGED